MRLMALVKVMVPKLVLIPVMVLVMAMVLMLVLMLALVLVLVMELVMALMVLMVQVLALALELKTCLELHLVPKFAAIVVVFGAVMVAMIVGAAVTYNCTMMVKMHSCMAVVAVVVVVVAVAVMGVVGILQEDSNSEAIDCQLISIPSNDDGKTYVLLREIINIVIAIS